MITSLQLKEEWNIHPIWITIRKSVIKWATGLASITGLLQHRSLSMPGNPFAHLGSKCPPCGKYKEPALLFTALSKKNSIWTDLTKMFALQSALVGYSDILVRFNASETIVCACELLLECANCQFSDATSIFGWIQESLGKISKPWFGLFVSSMRIFRQLANTIQFQSVCFTETPPWPSMLKRDPTGYPRVDVVIFLQSGKVGRWNFEQKSETKRMVSET